MHNQRSKLAIFTKVFVLALCAGGCRQTTCSDNAQATGDLDDAAPQGVCSTDTIAFSPQAIETSMMDQEDSVAGGSGGSTVIAVKESRVAVLLQDHDGQPRTLVNVDVFECGLGPAQDDDTERDVPDAALSASVPPLVQGNCVAVSATRLRCLTDYEGRAVFSVAIGKPTQGGVCAKKSTYKSTSTIVERLWISNSGNGGSGGAGGASNSTSTGVGGAN